MALADFYDRSALAASQVIAGFNEQAFKHAILKSRVGIAIGKQAISSPEGLALLDLSTKLIARLYPSIHFRADEIAQEEVKRMSLVAKQINPLIELTDEAEIGISIGMDAPTFSTSVFAGSDGWDSFLSMASPVPLGKSRNPFGPGAAACFAASELFRKIFVSSDAAQTRTDLTFSTFHRGRVVTETDVPKQSWNVGEHNVLVGVGAVGNAAAWALSRSDAKGLVHLVDGEEIELSNLQRYVLAERSHVDQQKVDVVTGYFDNGFKAVPHAQTWAAFLDEFGHRWENVLVGLDSAPDRRSVQAALPKWIANAWTQPGDLGVSLHGEFGEEGACLYCLYLPEQQAPNEDELVATALGVANLVPQVRILLHTGEGVDSQLLKAVAQGLGRDLESVLAYEGRPIRDLYVEGVCGGGIIPLGSAGSPRQELHVPLAHQSALAGILLAAALARRATAVVDTSTFITRIDVLGPVGEFLTQPALRLGSGRCICEDPDYVDVYRNKYGPD